jgi:hypothetical protein
VRTNARLVALRTFPVPEAVSPDKEIFMGSHFKIAQSGIISPLLHYHNDVRGTGRVYIGKHLRNTQTSKRVEYILQPFRVCRRWRAPQSGAAGPGLEWPAVSLPKSCFPAIMPSSGITSLV